MIRVYSNIHVIVFFSRVFCLIKLKIKNEAKEKEVIQCVHMAMHTQALVSGSQSDLAFLCMCHLEPAVAAA